MLLHLNFGVPVFPNEPEDKYLSKTEVYIKYVHCKTQAGFAASPFSIVTVILSQTE